MCLQNLQKIVQDNVEKVQQYRSYTPGFEICRLIIQNAAVFLQTSIQTIRIFKVCFKHKQQVHVTSVNNFQHLILICCLEY